MSGKRARSLFIPSMRGRWRRGQQQQHDADADADDGIVDGNNEDDGADVAKTFTESVVWYGPKANAVANKYHSTVRNDSRRSVLHANGRSSHVGGNGNGNTGQNDDDNDAVAAFGGDGDDSDGNLHSTSSISSARNGIGDSYDFSAAVVVHEGELWKLGGKVKNWKRRHFVLRESPNTLAYYHQTGGANGRDYHNSLKGKIHLVRGMNVGDAPEIAERPHAFKLIHDQRTWYFQADNAPSKDEWIMKIQRQLRKLESQYSTPLASSYSSKDVPHDNPRSRKHIDQKPNQDNVKQSQVRDQLRIFEQLRHAFGDINTPNEGDEIRGSENVAVRRELHKMIQKINGGSGTSTPNDGHSASQRHHFHLPVSARCCVDVEQDVLIKMPIRGRLYLLEHFLLFYCSFFGTVTQFLIPLDRISSVQLAHIERSDGTLHDMNIVTRKDRMPQRLRKDVQHPKARDPSAKESSRVDNSKRYHFYLDVPVASQDGDENNAYCGSDDMSKDFTTVDAEQLNKLVRLLGLQLDHLGVEDAHVYLPKRKSIIAERHFAMTSPSSPLVPEQEDSTFTTTTTTMTTVTPDPDLNDRDSDPESSLLRTASSDSLGNGDNETSDSGQPRMALIIPREECDTFHLSSIIEAQESRMQSNFLSNFSKLHQTLYGEPLPRDEVLSWQFFCLYRDFRRATRTNLWGTCFVSSSMLCFQGWPDMHQEVNDTFAALSGNGTWDVMDGNYTMSQGSFRRRTNVRWILRFDDIKQLNFVKEENQMADTLQTGAPTDTAATIEIVLNNGIRHFVTLVSSSDVLDNRIDQWRHDLNNVLALNESPRIDLARNDINSLGFDDERIMLSLQELKHLFCEFKHIPVQNKHPICYLAGYSIEKVDIPDRSEKLIEKGEDENPSTFSYPSTPHTATSTTMSQSFDNLQPRTTGNTDLNDEMSRTSLSDTQTNIDNGIGKEKEDDTIMDSQNSMRFKESDTRDREQTSMNDQISGHSSEWDGHEEFKDDSTQDQTHSETTVQYTSDDEDDNGEDTNQETFSNEDGHDHETESMDGENPSFIISDYFPDQPAPSDGHDQEEDHSNQRPTRGSSIFHRLSFRNAHNPNVASASEAIPGSPTIADDDLRMPKLIEFQDILFKRSAFNVLSKRYGLVLRQNIQTGDMILQLVRPNGIMLETKLLSQMRLVLLSSTSDILLHVKFLDNTSWNLYCRSDTQRAEISRYLTMVQRQSQTRPS